VSEQQLSVTLFFTGDSMTPAEISTALACSPTCSGQKGDPITHTNQCTGRVISRPAFRGYWGLTEHFQELDQLENAVNTLLKKVTSDISAWEHLTAKFEGYLVCDGVLSEEDEFHATVGPSLLRDLANRRLKLTFNAAPASRT
jgi:hypothetical protein